MTAVAEASWTDADTAALRELVADEDARQWQIGDLLTERLPVGSRGQSTGVMAALREIAAQVGAEPAALRKYRDVAHSWPNGTRVPFATWSAHRAYCGSPDSAVDRATTLRSLPRNEHGYVTKQAVRDLTRGGGGKPGWLELMGMAADKLIAAGKDLDKVEADLETKGWDNVTPAMAEKAARYRVLAESLAVRFRLIEEAA